MLLLFFIPNGSFYYLDADIYTLRKIAVKLHVICFLNTKNIQNASEVLHIPRS